MATEANDVVVYGNTWSAVNAACGASVESKRTLRVVLVMNYLHVGGIVSNGLSELDFGSKGINGISWLTLEFLRRVTQLMGKEKILRRVSPAIAERLFMRMLKFHGVLVRAPLTLQSVQKTGAAITSITMTDGTVFTGSQFIDGTEEGDLAKMAGVTMTVGRESMAQYGEGLAGFSAVEAQFRPFNCYEYPGGPLLSGFSTHPGLNIGDADGGVQSYGFRLCITNVKANKRKWPKPVGYNPALFEYRRRTLGHTNGNWRAFRIGMCVDGKADMNADFGGPLQWQWPDATPAQRVTLLAQIYLEQASWMWFLANDASVHPNVKAYVNSWGLCKDELFGSAGTTLGWGKELYVRVARRMVGKYVLKQQDTQTTPTKTTGIAVGYYSLDNHLVNKYAVVRGGVAGYIPDSFSYRFAPGNERFVTPYQIPYACLLPLAAECSNLLVCKAISMSNVAASSFRIDIQTANVGSVAGLCAAYAIMNGVTVDAIDALIVTVIQPKLTAYGHNWQPPA